ncbi:MAG: VanZ family protein [Bacteroidales bacterium]|nr:VanZ family protein [Bacteroidales bacterium]
MIKILKLKYSIIWSLFILTLLLLPSNELPTNNLHIKHLDKIAHFGIFAILAIINFYEIRKTKKRYKLLKISTLIFLFALSTEILQIICTKYRQFDAFDIIADLTGYHISLLLNNKLYKDKVSKIF